MSDNPLPSPTAAETEFFKSRDWLIRVCLVIAAERFAGPNSRVPTDVMYASLDDAVARYTEADLNVAIERGDVPPDFNDTLATFLGENLPHE